MLNVACCGPSLRPSVTNPCEKSKFSGSSINTQTMFLGERSKKVSTKTMLNELGLLQSIFSLAVENDLIERSPVRSKHKTKSCSNRKAHLVTG